MDALLEELLDSPDLPRKLLALNEAFAEEQLRRERFYADMTDDRRMEFINGKVVMHSLPPSGVIQRRWAFFSGCFLPMWIAAS